MIRLGSMRTTAAIAIRSGLAIVTGDTAHFEHVRTARYDLRIDDWRVP